MLEGRFLTIAEQVAAHLRDEISRGRWSETMPGKHHLAEELEVDNKTVEAALWQLEEGLLAGQGAGRKRRIVVPEGGFEAPALRVAIPCFFKGINLSTRPST